MVIAPQAFEDARIGGIAADDFVPTEDEVITDTRYPLTVGFETAEAVSRT